MGTYSVITLTNGSNVNFDHCDFYDNYTNNDWVFRIYDTDSHLNVSNSIIYDFPSILSTPDSNLVNITYTLSSNPYPGEGNIVGNPLLSDSLQLTMGSPCVDAGDPDYPLDPDSTRTDMGVFYFDQIQGGPISGEISGIWTAENNPYEIGGDVYIPSSDTLIIQEGVVVDFLINCRFDVFGVLQVQGEETDSVYINASGSWIYFNSAVGNSYLQYAYIVISTINLLQSPVIINHCKLYTSIHAENSSSNQISDSYINGTIQFGDHWDIKNSSIYKSVYSTGIAYVCGISNAGGTFENNVIDVYAHADPGMWLDEALAYGFQNCDGDFIGNNVVANASAGEEYAYGFIDCIGNCSYNTITAETDGISLHNGNIINNTIIDADYGIRDITGIVKNNIVQNCGTGFSGSFEVSYSCVHDCNTPYSGVTVGPGNIQQDPLLIGWNLSPNSPCIDTGDPASPPDRDGTRADMGANYYDQGTPALEVTLTPHNPPIQIPPGGGSFQYDILIENTSDNTYYFDAWIDALLPNMTVYGPIILRENLTLEPDASIVRDDMTQFVPANAPAGEYTYYLTLGNYPEIFFVNDSFQFEKLTGEGIPNHNQGWALYGWGDTEIASVIENVPLEYSLHHPFPNPFNPATTIRFDIADAGNVKLVVYDILGREAAVIAEGFYPAGYHSVVFDGSDLASGIYFARLQAGEYIKTQKLLLIK